MSFQKRKSRIKLSIIIPAFNQAESLKKQLVKLGSIIKHDWEIIVVDDASSDETEKITQRFPIIYHRFRRNRGPAYCRNYGAKLARGEILLFLDADSIPYVGSIQSALDLFKKNPSIQVLSGIWSMQQENDSFVSNYKAVRDWCFYTKEVQNEGTFFFNTRVGMIKKDLFFKVGGFCTKYKKADLESLEFSFRLKKYTDIHWSPKFLVKHQAANLCLLIKNYFKRTCYFLELYGNHGSFGKVVVTFKEATAVILSGVFIPILLVGFTFKPLLSLLFICVVIYIALCKQFLLFFYKTKGFQFMLASFVFNYFLHLVIFSAFVFYFFTNPKRVVSFIKL